MNGEQQQDKEQRFVEEVGLFFEQRGLPRMAGRILGWLLISDPLHQSADELAEALMASKGSISTMTRLLIRMGMVQRTSLPGQRRDYFFMNLDNWDEWIKDGLTRVTAFRSLTERGLELLEGKDPQIRQRLERMRAMYAFFEREFPALLERWKQEGKR